MADDRTERLPHIHIKGTAKSEGYTRPRGGRGPNFNLPSRNRQDHANNLLKQLADIQEEESNLISKQKALGLDAGYGIFVSFESEPHFELKFNSLDFQPSGIELCSIKQLDHKSIATVFVPEGKLSHFLKKVKRYRDENTRKKNKPKSRDLIESISAIKLAALESLWTDDSTLFPEANVEIWWEVWLRHSDQVDYEKFLRENSNRLEISVSNEAIQFLDRTVLLIKATREKIAESIFLLSAIAELRDAKVTADFFTGLNLSEQSEWAIDLLGRLSIPPEGAPWVCLLDTGVNEQHPLLKPVADTADMHVCDPAWGTEDRQGHGTPMAGLAIYGDLIEKLSSSNAIDLSHRLESVKITPHPEFHEDRSLFGAFTKESIHRVEINPFRKRIYVMAVSATDSRDRGRPSSWSAAIDSLSFGSDDLQRRLIILCAGNTDPNERHHHPYSNMTDSIHDPGQAWNALTVGAFTEKVVLDTQKYPGWKSIAEYGDLSPSSCTSMEWGNKSWPIKPDIVMEGGNMAFNPEFDYADYIDDSLQLVSTGHQLKSNKLLISFGDTSAASAQASYLAALLQSHYPDYWPETIRGLLVHSARWTQGMQAHFQPLNTQKKMRQLLRYCGYGTPNLEELLWSTRNSLTLIAQDTLYPYFKNSENRVKTKDMNLHKIPWPTDVLRDLGGTEVEMRITLSYFVEPNPGERGWKYKFRYASHGLRFDVKRSLENLNEFEKRINQQARKKDPFTSASESGKWALGEKLRNLGSIHSDVWHGTAADLAERDYIAVYPVIGWWRERPKFERWKKQVRYALIVNIKTHEIETDIYTPVASEIKFAIDIQV